jgi:hypothetical protein
MVSNYSYIYEPCMRHTNKKQLRYAWFSQGAGGGVRARLLLSSVGE